MFNKVFRRVPLEEKQNSCSEEFGRSGGQSNAGIKGPYVLVGQFFGGFLVRAFARIYPNDVVGMVLVDALSEDLKVNIGRTQNPRKFPVA